MKNTFKSFAILVALFAMLAFTPVLEAQTTTTSTTLSAAITDLTNTTITVASATGFTAGTTAVFIDREYAEIRAVSGTTITLSGRGQGGTRAETHYANAIVWVGPRGNNGPFSNTDGTVNEPAPGRCVSTNVLYLPQINIISGNIWNCVTVLNFAESITDTTSTGRQLWQSVNLIGQMSNIGYRTVTNVVFTATLADSYLDVNSLTTTRILNLPSVTAVFGKVLMIKNGGAAAANITVTAPNGQYIGTPGTATLSLTNTLTVRLISTGGGWNTF